MVPNNLLIFTAFKVVFVLSVYKYASKPVIYTWLIPKHVIKTYMLKAKV